MHPVILRALKTLRGGRRARHVIPAVVLGALAGAVCGWNLTFAAVVTAAVIINGPVWDPLESTCRHASLSIL